MAFLPPINIGSFKPSPATLAQWVYDIWQYLQENPIATQEDISTYIQNYFETSPEVQEVVGEVVAQYLLDNPPQAPVQSVQGKTGAVSLTYPDIVPASNAVPVYRAASAPNVSTAQGLYNNGYRLFVNTATQEIFTISNSGALSLVGRGKFDGTTVDLDTAQGDTTIAEAVTAIENRVSAVEPVITDLNNGVIVTRTVTGTALTVNGSAPGDFADITPPAVSGYTPVGILAYNLSGSGVTWFYVIRVNFTGGVAKLSCKNSDSAQHTITPSVVFLYVKTGFLGA